MGVDTPQLQFLKFHGDRYPAAPTSQISWGIDTRSSNFSNFVGDRYPDAPTSQISRTPRRMRQAGLWNLRSPTLHPTLLLVTQTGYMSLWDMPKRCRAACRLNDIEESKTYFRTTDHTWQRGSRYKQMLPIFGEQIL